MADQPEQQPSRPPQPLPPLQPPIRQPPLFYSNVARVMHTEYDVFIDFATRLPDTPDFAAISARIVMSPQHTKALLKALFEHLKKYEESYGKIPLPGDFVMEKSIKEFFNNVERSKPGEGETNAGVQGP
ncbi:MAG: DUF3467 domain-containing protein [Candidatus Tectomicrobia bacterium]|nr:DUF3467 domain-containing protein [Candidatus Tectomicrobia bacterium]